MQLALAAIGGPAADTQWLELKQRLLEAIALITPKDLCWRLGIKETYLSDAVAERDRKTIKASWVPVILAMAPDGARRAILEVLSKPVGYDVSRRRELTAEEKLQRALDRIKQEFGKAGHELAEELR
jgi:hypothetical protein